MTRGDKEVRKAENGTKRISIDIAACQKFIQSRLELEVVINIHDLFKEIKRSRKFAIKKEMDMATFLTSLLFNDLPDREIVLFQYQGEVLLCLAKDFGEIWKNIVEKKE